MEPVEFVVHADHVDVPERLIVAPAAGVYRISSSVAAATGGEVEAGQTLGAIERIEGQVDVVCPHTGRLMGFLALHGERVRMRQPLAWVRGAEGSADGRGNAA